MTPTRCGAHCTSCKKEVIDFTTWSDEALAGFFRSGAGVCGRLRDDQLGKLLSTQPTKDRSCAKTTNGSVGWLATFILSAFVMLSRPANGQLEKEPVKTEQILKDDTTITRLQALKNFSEMRSRADMGPVIFNHRPERTSIGRTMGCVSVVIKVTNNPIRPWITRVDELLH